MRIVFLTTCLTLIAACSDLPDIKDSLSAQTAAAPYPALIALQPVATQTDALDQNALETEEELRLRSEALRARAAGLRKPVLDADERSRLTPTLN